MAALIKSALLSAARHGLTGLIIAFAVVFFHCGPWVLEWFVDKVDEWEDVLESLEKEK